nr:MMPL family transporter [Succinivibrio sp.]
LSALPQAPTDSSVLSLLPSFDRQNQKVEQEFLKRLDTQLVFLITAPDPQLAAQAASAFKARLEACPLLERTFSGPSADDLVSYGKFYFEHAAALVDAKTRLRLQAGTQAQQVLSSLYLPIGGALGPELKQDPLLLMRSRQLYEQEHSLSHFKREGDLSYLEADGRRYYLVYAQSRQAGFETSSAKELGAFVDNCIAELAKQYQEVTVLKRGTLFYNRYFAEHAQHDLTFLGSATIGGVILLLLVSFRSLIPLLLTLISIGCGLTLGTCAVLMCFGKMHLITMVMGLSIIGICTDYSIYYLSRRLLHGATEGPLGSIRKLKPVLTHALLTTTSAYLLLLIPPFPGLRQLAVFCMAGLIGAYAAVLLWQPLLVSRLRPQPLKLHWCAGYLNFFGQARIPLTLGIAALSALGLGYVQIDDDPKALQSAPEFLQAEDSEIARIMGQDNSQTYLLLKADTESKLEAALPEVTELLEHSVKEQFIASYLMPHYNPKAQQLKDFKLVEENLHQVKELLEPLKLYPDHFSYNQRALTLSDFMQGPEGLVLKTLYLQSDEEVALLVPLFKLRHSSELRQQVAKLDGISATVIDRRSDFTEVFRHYRQSLSYLLGLALLLLFALHLYQQRSLFKALRLLMPTVLALALACAGNALCGYPLTLFTLLSLFLVLGIGIDYVLIFRQSQQPSHEVLFAITLAMLTTLLTLGVLMFSSTQVTASFGLTLSLGILGTYLLAPWTSPEQSRQSA